MFSVIPTKLSLFFEKDTFRFRFLYFCLLPDQML